jgi:hypothetical protein
MSEASKKNTKLCLKYALAPVIKNPLAPAVTTEAQK